MRTQGAWVWGAGLFCLLGCGDSDDKQKGALAPDKIESEYLQKLRDCDLVSEGKFGHLDFQWGGREPEVETCYAQCFTDLIRAPGCAAMKAVVCDVGEYELFDACLAVCDAWQFECKDGSSTFSRNQKCDGRADCDDRTDEQGCFRWTGTCDNGKVLGLPQEIRLLACSGHEECEDGSDETNCPEPVLCKNGEQIPAVLVCDGKDDCADGEDEASCEVEMFECDNTQTVLAASVCDGYADCADGSDESEAQGCAQLTCPAADYHCGNGVRIPNAELCDETPQCLDGSDERAALCEAVFECKNGDRFVDAECNGIEECRGGEDEKDCDEPTEPQTGFRCVDGSYVDEWSECDGFRDCNDGSDELDCYEPPVPPASCDAGASSYELLQVCDGILDCLDGADEAGCGTPVSLRCSATEVVSADKACDGVTDCASGRDEASCFFCTDTGAGILERFVCDGIPDCADDSDETCP